MLNELMLIVTVLLVVLTCLRQCVPLRYAKPQIDTAMRTQDLENILSRFPKGKLTTTNPPHEQKGRDPGYRHAFDGIPERRKTTDDRTDQLPGKAVQTGRGQFNWDHSTFLRRSGEGGLTEEVHLGAT